MGGWKMGGAEKGGRKMGGNKKGGREKKDGKGRKENVSSVTLGEINVRGVKWIWLYC